jgi:hypothetical protein
MAAQFRITAPTQLRQEPGRDAVAIADLAPGTVVEREGRKVRRWVPVRHEGRSGWVVERVLEKVEGGAEPDPGPNGGTDPNRVWTEAEIVRIIREAARAFGQPEEDMVRVARCESVLDPRAVNPQGPWFGLFQFHRATWASTPFAERDIFDPVANANAAAWMWREGRRNEWTCQ